MTPNVPCEPLQLRGPHDHPVGPGIPWKNLAKLLHSREYSLSQGKDTDRGQQWEEGPGQRPGRTRREPPGFSLSGVVRMAPHPPSTHQTHPIRNAHPGFRRPEFSLGVDRIDITDHLHVGVSLQPPPIQADAKQPVVPTPDHIVNTEVQSPQVNMDTHHAGPSGSEVTSQ